MFLLILAFVATQPEALPLPAGAVRIGTAQFRSIPTGLHPKAFFTADAKTLVVAAGSNGVEFWDPATSRCIHELLLPKSSVDDADFQANSNLLAMAGTHFPEDKNAKPQLTVWIVDIAIRKIVRTIPVVEFFSYSQPRIRLTPDGKRAVLGINGELRVWDVKSGDELIRQKLRSNVDAFALSPDGKKVIFGRYDLYEWNWESGEEPKKFASIGGFGVQLAAFSPDGSTLYVGGLSDKLTKYEVATGKLIGTLNTSALVRSISFSPDGKALAIAPQESGREAIDVRHVFLLASTTGEVLARLPIGQTRPGQLSWSQDGSRLVLATDSRLWAWDVKTKALIGPISRGHESPISAFAFAPQGRLFSASDDQTIRSWDDVTGKPGLVLTHGGWVRSLAISSNGALVAGSALRNDLRIWDTKTGISRFKLLGNGVLGGKRIVRFTADGQRLVAWGDDMYLRIWNTQNGRLLTEYRTLPEDVTEAQFENDNEMLFLRFALQPTDISLDGSTMAYYSGKSILVRDVGTGKERAKFEAGQNGISLLALSSDGKRIAIIERAKQTSIRMPDGRTRTQSDPEHQVAVWDLATQKAVWQAKCSASHSFRIAFSPDGTRVAETTSSDDSKRYWVQIWDAANGKDLGQIDLPIVGRDFAFDATAKRIVVAQEDTTAIIFDLAASLKPSGSK